MNLEGFNTINTALEQIGANIVSSPPVDDEHIRYVTVHAGENQAVPTPPADVLNALGRAGLIRDVPPRKGGPVKTVRPKGPLLHCMFASLDGSLTFEDTNNGF